MRAFRYRISTDVVFGADSESKTAALVKQYGGSRVLIVYGGGSAVKSGLLGRIEQQMKEAGIVYELLGGVQPNPRVALARTGAAKAVALDADMILGVGGGSVLDTCKAIAHAAANGVADPWEIWMNPSLVKKSLPIGAVLTIPAAGSETSDSAVLTNEETEEKRGLNTDFNRPAFAILDPKLAMSLPRFHLGCGVTDIMMHTLDRYFNAVTDNELTDELAEALLRVVIRHGVTVIKHPDDAQAMSEIMWAGSVSHNGLTGLGGTKDFSVHQLGHALSAKFDAIHGASLAATWASWARHVYKANPARFVRYAKTVWGIAETFSEEETALAGIAATEAYFQALGMPVGLPALCGKQDAAGLADLALRCSYQKTRTIGSLMALGYDDIYAIFAAANERL